MKTGFYAIGVIFIVGLIVIAALPRSTPTSETDKLQKFASYDELKNFIKTSSEVPYDGYAMGATMRETTLMPASASDKASGDYSTTNIQVAGVDEADIIKNDGKYIYTVSGNSVIIIDAYPAQDAKILSQINLSGVSNIFINGDKLVVFGNLYDYVYPMPLAEPVSTTVAEPKIAADIMMPRPYYNTQTSFIKVYDVSDRANPVLVKNVTASGSYFDSRMIGDYVYAMTNQYVYGDVIPLPYVMENGITLREFPDIYYFPIPDRSYNYVNIVALNINTDETATKTFMMPSSQTTYVSQNNIYLTYQKWVSYYDYYDRIFDEVLISTFPQLKQKIDEIRGYNISSASKYNEIQILLQDYMSTLSREQFDSLQTSLQEKMKPIEQAIEKERQKTYVSKISVSGSQINYEAQGYVVGSLLNQFSMDEYNGYFRVATTTSMYSGGEYTSTNNVYVLDGDMKTVGTLDGVAPGESIYSVRFMGDRAYMVTFKHVDPLFVLDLSNPAAPSILGKLKIPGYSDYLHPYDETHIIGIGKEVDESIDADKVHSQDAVYYTAIQGVKISIFDVSDVTNPVEMYKQVIGDRGTNSLATSDHKAFLFDKEKQLLVVPMVVAERKPTDSKSAEGDYTFSGAYVYNINLQSGLTLKGRITHMNSTEMADMTTKGYWYYSGSDVKRSLYIGDTLYTLSNKMIKANTLTDLADVSTVALPYTEFYYDGPYYAL